MKIVINKMKLYFISKIWMNVEILSFSVCSQPRFTSNMKKKNPGPKLEKCRRRKREKASHCPLLGPNVRKIKWLLIITPLLFELTQTMVLN
jgi:hypothetical protein